VFQGVIRAAVWLGIIHTACVTHWWQQGGGSGLGRGSPRQGADLRGGARRRGHVRTVLGLNPSERGSVSGCGVNANPKPGSRKAGVLCGGSAMADPRRARRRDAGMGCLGSWGAPWPKISRARGWGGSQRCSPRLGNGRRCGARWSTTRSGGGDGAELAVRAVLAPPGSWAARVVEWLRCEAEQGVREGRGPLVARKFDGGPFSPDLKSGTIPALRG